MTTTIYILLSQLGIVVLYLLYKLFLAGDTFLHSHRYTLLCGILFAHLYPFVYFYEPYNRVDTWYERINTQYEVILPAITVGTEQSAGSVMLIDLYYIGVVLGAIFLIVRLFSVLSLRWRSDCHRVEGIKVYHPRTDVVPFSFGSAIFINVDKYEPAMMRDILLHERAHVRGCHTIDLMLGELMVIVGWFNPFAWLLRREMHLVVETLADARAVKATHSIKDYQYHLLQVVQNKWDIRSFGTHFNYKMLMQRIKKINQADSHMMRRLVYLVLLPAMLCLITLSHASNALYRYVAQSITEQVEPGINTIVEPQTSQETALIANTLPQFPGGDNALNKFIADNITYPTKAKQEQVQGMVIVRFVVDSKGNAVSPSILRSLSPECDAEVKRIVSIMPRWSPAMRDGVATDVDFVMPVTFKLQE